MTWEVQFHDDFMPEFRALSKAVRVELTAKVKLLETFGPELGRPHVDTLNASEHANMKELRFDADNGVRRAAFAFDLARKAILIVAGDKSGVSERQFYKKLIDKADKRFGAHIGRQKAEKKAAAKSKKKGR